MADKRISEIAKTLNSTEIKAGDFIAIDDLATNTGKATISDFTKGIASLISSSKFVNLLINLDGDFSVSTNGLGNILTTSGDFIDGLELIFRADNISAFFQNKLNPKIIVDGQAPKDVVSDFWYSHKGSTDFDVNTIANGNNVFVYDASLQAFRHRVTNSPTGTVHYFGEDSDVAGFLRLSGQALNEIDYPNYTTYFEDQSTVQNHAEVSLVGVGTESPIGKIKDGQMEKITGQYDTLEGYSGNGYRDYITKTTGAYTTGYTNDPADDSIYVNITNTRNTAFINFDSSRVAKTGNATLTKRIATGYRLIKI